MHQMTLRITDDLARRLKLEAEKRGRSVNAFAGDVLGAAVDPDLEGTEIERLRARLVSAGLVEPVEPYLGKLPDPDEVARARARAGGGKKLLADLISEDRS